jgi:hypothetical protein
MRTLMTAGCRNEFPRNQFRQRRGNPFDPVETQGRWAMTRTRFGLPILVLLVAAVGCSSHPASPSRLLGEGAITAASTSAKGGRAATTGVVYVTRQGLYFDTFVARDPLPMKGPFQLLENGRTEFGPGDPGYLGGRWWEDVNHNGVQDAGDHFFLCPLLPPGRATP